MVYSVKSNRLHVFFFYFNYELYLNRILQNFLSFIDKLLFINYIDKTSYKIKKF